MEYNREVALMSIEKCCEFLRQNSKQNNKMNEKTQESNFKPCDFRNFQSLIKHGLNDDKTPTASSVEQVNIFNVLCHFKAYTRSPRIVWFYGTGKNRTM